MLADRPRGARFLVLGSASPELLRQTSETLAGRIASHHLDGLSLREVGSRRASDLWLRGGFPRSLVAKTLGTSLRWRRNSSLPTSNGTFAGEASRSSAPFLRA